MAFGDDYSVGTVSLYSGDHTKVIGSGTLWATALVAGDRFEHAGLSVKIASVEDDTHLTLAYAWPSTSFTAATYLATMTSPSRYQTLDLAGRVRDLINRLRIFDTAVPVYSVREFGINILPGDAVAGDIFVVGTSPTGELAGHANQIVEITDNTGGRLYTTAEHGWAAIDEDQNLVHTWTGTGWASAVGLGATVTFAGAWNSLSDYATGNVVTYSDKAWIATSPNTNSTPSEASSDWDLFLTFGTDGGGLTFRYRFSTDTAATDPTAGYLKLNNASPGSATILLISKTDLYGNNWGSLIAAIATSTTSARKGTARIATKNDPTRQWIASVMNATAQSAGDYYQLTLSGPAASLNALQNNAEIVFTFTERGDVGAQGIQGIQGLRGYAGGPYALTFTFDGGSQADSDPGTGKLRLNQSTQKDATVMRVNLTDNLTPGVDRTSELDGIVGATESVVKANARLFLASDPSKCLVGKITAVQTKTNYRNITFSPVNHSSDNPFNTGDPLVLVWIPNGDKGDAGTVTINSVTTGAPGSSVSVVNSGTAQSALLDITIPRGDQGVSFSPTHAVNTLSGRAAYNAAAEGVSVLVHSDSSNGNQPWLYFKLSSASGDWSVGQLWTLAALTASDIDYDHTTSGLAATDTQAAIDELKVTTNTLSTGIDDANANAIAMAIALS